MVVIIIVHMLVCTKTAGTLELDYTLHTASCRNHCILHLPQLDSLSGAVQQRAMAKHHQLRRLASGTSGMDLLLFLCYNLILS